MRQVTPGQGINLTAIAKDTRAGVSCICRVEDIVPGNPRGVMAWQKALPALLWPSLAYSGLP